MSTNQHKFSDSYQRGLRGEEATERFLDVCGLNWSTVTSRSAQKQGKDYTVENAVSIEVKTDDMALETGNVFIEVVGNDQKGTPGWAHYTQADMLFYIIGNECIVCSPVVIRKMLDNWGERYAVKQCHNKHYSSEGIIVPVHAFKRDAGDYIFDIEEPDNESIDETKTLVKMFLRERVSGGFPWEPVTKLLMAFDDIKGLQWMHCEEAEEGGGYTVKKGDESCTLTVDDRHQLLLWSVGTGYHVGGVFPLVSKYERNKLLPCSTDMAINKVKLLGGIDFD